MPVHDWSEVRAGVFHNFHQAWTIEIYKALNRDVLPPGYFAMAEQVTGGPIPDVVCLEKWPVTSTRSPVSGGTALADKPPEGQVQRRASAARFAMRANRITIREPLGEVVAVIEVVSPGNKSSRSALQSFVDKATGLLERGIHLLIIDLFPPGRNDPRGLHDEIWSSLGESETDEGKPQPLNAVAYSVGDEITAYVNGFAVGDCLPSAPVFLEADRYVPAPLESTYQTTWSELPQPVQQLFE